MPSCCATLRATSARSPVSITVRLTPAAFSASMAWRASFFTTSEITMCPRYCPFRATCTMVPTFWHAGAATPMRAISLALPAQIVSPSKSAFTPSPAISSTPPTCARSMLSSHALRSDCAMG